MDSPVERTICGIYAFEAMRCDQMCLWRERGISDLGVGRTGEEARCGRAAVKRTQDSRSLVQSIAGVMQGERRRVGLRLCEGTKRRSQQLVLHCRWSLADML